MLVSIDEPPWASNDLIALEPVDGVFDSLSETASTILPASALTSGVASRIFVVAEDEAGNRGPPYAILFSGESVFQDGFEGAVSSQTVKARRP